MVETSDYEIPHLGINVDIDQQVTKIGKCPRAEMVLYLF